MHWHNTEKRKPPPVGFDRAYDQADTNRGGLPVVNTYTAITKQDGDWWIGWIEEVPGVNCQEKTRKELLESLRITLREALELNS